MRQIGYSHIWVGAALGFGLLIVMACSGSGSFQGTTLNPADVAPSFQLRDQVGDPVGLSDLAGKVVVLTFLYTYCPDVCPLVTETLRRTHQLLGSDASEVELVAITVDPKRDTVERAYQYSQEKDMLNRWRFLVGSEEQIASIWRAYWLDPVRDAGVSQDDSHGDGLQDQDDHNEGDVGARATTDGVANGYLVSHTAPVFLIDRRGYRRVLFTDLSLDPQPLVHDIRLLIKGSS